jgi:hypothetical protein
MLPKLHIHILPVAAIALVLLLLGWFFRPAPTPSPVTELDYAITIIRANWGLNCLPADVPELSELENNAAETVKAHCEGQKSCRVLLDKLPLGPGPVALCQPKMLVVDYRCFNLDRIHRAQFSYGALALQCPASQPAEPTS